MKIYKVVYLHYGTWRMVFERYYTYLQAKAMKHKIQRMGFYAEVYRGRSR